MKEKLNTTQGFDKEHKRFGGIIYQSDFNTEHRWNNKAASSSIASRIISDYNRERKITAYTKLKEADN